jgi:hypothetical protein
LITAVLALLFRVKLLCMCVNFDMLCLQLGRERGAPNIGARRQHS